MPLRVNANIPALNVRRIMSINNRDLKNRIERLSSGLRINRASDDTAGLNISEGMRAELTGLRQSVRNAEQATNLIQTGEGALNEVNAIFIRMRELAVQSASSTVTDDNRESINSEYVQLINEIDRIASVTSYNRTTLLGGYGNNADTDVATSTALDSAATGVTGFSITGAAAGTYIFEDDVDDRSVTLGNGVTSQTIDIGPGLDTDDVGGVVATGSAIVANFDRLGIQLTLSGYKAEEGSNPELVGYRDGAFGTETGADQLELIINSGTGGTFQVGPRNGAVHRLEINIEDMRASGTVLNMGSTSVTTLGSAQTSISSIDLAITKVAQQRGDLGAFQNRLSFNIRANENTIENIQASESAIRDADIGEEVSAFTRAQILVQSGTALLAQANVLPQNALSLLG